MAETKRIHWRDDEELRQEVSSHCCSFTRSTWRHSRILRLSSHHTSVSWEVSLRGILRGIPATSFFKCLGCQRRLNLIPHAPYLHLDFDILVLQVSFGSMLTSWFQHLSPARSVMCKSSIHGDSRNRQLITLSLLFDDQVFLLNFFLSESSECIKMVIDVAFVSLFLFWK